MDDRFDTTLKNDSMMEFFVTIKGPKDSTFPSHALSHDYNDALRVRIIADNAHDSTLRGRHLENPRRAPRRLPAQESQRRLHEQDLASQRR